MNHLAHLYLARPTLESRIGNLLGDFARGVDVHALPAPVRQGLANHRAVDTFTDCHPLVREAKALFSPRRRRFAGVALDVLFDHYLIRHWNHFSQEDRATFTQSVYRDLRRGRDLMPPTMQQVTASIVEYDWFGSYASLDGIGYALDRVARRIRFPNRFDGIVDEIRDLDDELDSTFLAFFPELITHIQERRLEVP